MKTIKQLVDHVHQTVVNQGMDLSPADVGQIISLFLEGMIHAQPTPGVDEVLQRIADECSSVKDE